LLNLIQSWSSESVQFYVGYSFGGHFESLFRKSQVPLFKYCCESVKIKSLTTACILFRLVRFMKKEGIDIVHTHNFNAHIWGLLAAKMAGVKVLEHVHDYRYMEPQEFKRRKGVSRQYGYLNYLKNSSDKVLVLTADNTKYLRKHGFYKPDKIKRIPNGITMLHDEAVDKRELLKKWSLEEDALIVLTPARLVPEKNVELILKIAPEVISKCPKVQFLISGSGPLLEPLQNKIREQHLDAHVKMIGFHQNILSLLACSHVFLLPSFLELQSIAILEALKMKVPIVVSKGVGSIEDNFEHGTNALLLDPFVTVGWAEAICSLLSDEAKRKKLIEKGYQTCSSKYDIMKTIPCWEEIYHEMV